MKDFENPEPKAGETRAKFVQRCRPIVHKEHPSWKMSKVMAVCHSIWERKHKNEMEAAGYEQFHDEAQLIIEKADGDTSGTKNIVALVGNRFMNGGYLTAELAKKTHKQWNKTLHDINHMGTSTGFFLMQTDITYFIGYHTKAKWNENNKSVSMELHIHDKTKFAGAWEAYLELCEMAGQIVNVSTTYFGKREFLPTNKLPKGCNWKKEGYGKDDLVPVLTEMQPFCISTVLRGRCDDKGGCGIRNTSSDSCTCGSCATKAEKDPELLKRIEAKEKELKELKESEDN